MPRPRTNNVQINIAIPSEWKKELENLARIYSVEEGKTITFLDLMRRGIQEKYQLKDVNCHRASHCKCLVQYHIIWCPKFENNVRLLQNVVSSKPSLLAVRSSQ